MDFTEYIKPELLALVPALIFIGYCIKHKTTADNKDIPWVLGVLGILFAAVYVLATTLPFESAGDVLMAAFTAAVQGLLCATAAVFANQIYKQKTEE